MIFIGLKKRTLGIVILVLVLCLVIVSIYSAVQVSRNESKYQSVLNMAQMFDDTQFIAYILSDEELVAQALNIEVFDIKRGEVISKTPLTIDIQNEVFNYVNTVKSLYTQVIPFPDKGYVIRVPFSPAKNVNVKAINEQGIKSVDQVFIILSDKEAPILLILDNQRRPFFFTFNASIKPLLDYIKLIPQQSTQSYPEA